MRVDYRVRTRSEQVGGEAPAERSELRGRNESWGLGRLGVQTHPIPFLLCKEHRGTREAMQRPMNVTESPVYVFIAKQCKPQCAQTCLSTYQQGIRNRQASLTSSTDPRTRSERLGAEPRSEIPPGHHVLERGRALWPGAMASTPRKLENLVLSRRQTPSKPQIRLRPLRPVLHRGL